MSSDAWERRSLSSSGFGQRGDSGPLDECFHRVRLCAATGGGTAAADSRDCLLTLNQPYTPTMSTALDERWAVPAPLLFFEDGKVCSHALALPSACLQPLHVWLPPLPDKTTSAFAYQSCCTPPKSCAVGSELCTSTCRVDSLSAWLEFSRLPS
jgi:hypothetical protein